ncbi:hypothetical protein [Pseudomonas sp. DC3000-4b1]|uniref:hypothetical protein n=1 Tax=unclassified Pseudomonas TaxID=196821 RepID=UPI003CF4CF22
MITPPPTSPLYEDALATLRLATLLATSAHHPEKAAPGWLEALIQQLQLFGWDPASREQLNVVYTPTADIWKAVFLGQMPDRQRLNTRFKSLVGHVIRTRSDGTQPLPPSVSDTNIATHLQARIQLPTDAPARLRLVQTSGSPDPQAPKTRLPVARTRWEGIWNPGRFETQRPYIEHRLQAFEQAALE